MPKARSFGSTGCRRRCRSKRPSPAAIETAVEVFADGTPFGDDRTMVMLRREA